MTSLTDFVNLERRKGSKYWQIKEMLLKLGNKEEDVINAINEYVKDTCGVAWSGS